MTSNTGVLYITLSLVRTDTVSYFAWQRNDLSTLTFLISEPSGWSSVQQIATWRCWASRVTWKSGLWKPYFRIQWNFPPIFHFLRRTWWTAVWRKCARVAVDRLWYREHGRRQDSAAVMDIQVHVCRETVWRSDSKEPTGKVCALRHLQCCSVTRSDVAAAVWHYPRTTVERVCLHSHTDVHWRNELPSLGTSVLLTTISFLCII